MTGRAVLAAVAMLLFAQVHAQEAVRLPCAASDKACAWKAMRSHAVRRVDMWKPDLARPLDARIGAAPPALVEYLTLDNIVNGFPQTPRAELPEPAFMADAKAAIAELPPQVWRLFADRLVGIYFVGNLGGTGFSDVVKDSAGKPVAAYIVLDAAVLRPLAANAWATWKESSPFRPRNGHALAARIEDGAGDNRKNAIQYILLHELGHVLSLGASVHPPWDIEPKDVPASARHAFFELSWTIDRKDNRYAALADKDFPQRREVSYYKGYRLDASDMVPVYANLEKTNFPTLYAATQPFDDFAEAFASYVHVVMMRRPWQIVLSQDGQVVKTVNHCWDEPRCAAKRKLLEEIVR
jgi:hypothetical protein